MEFSGPQRDPFDTGASPAATDGAAHTGADTKFGHIARGALRLSRRHVIVIRTRGVPWRSRPSRALLAILAALTLLYLIFAEAMKRRLYRRHLD